MSYHNLLPRDFYCTALLFVDSTHRCRHKNCMSVSSVAAPTLPRPLSSPIRASPRLNCLTFAWGTYDCIGAHALATCGAPNNRNLLRRLHAWPMSLKAFMRNIGGCGVMSMWPQCGEASYIATTPRGQSKALLVLIERKREFACAHVGGKSGGNGWKSSGRPPTRYCLPGTDHANLVTLDFFPQKKC